MKPLDRFLLGARSLLLASTGSSPAHGHSFSTSVEGEHDHQLEDHWRATPYVFCSAPIGPSCGLPPHIDEKTTSTRAGRTTWACPIPPRTTTGRPTQRGAYVMRRF